MRETRVFTRQSLLTGGSVALDDTAARHLNQVLRMQVGQPLTLFNGDGGEYSGTIESCSRNRVIVKVETLRDTERESPVQITLWHGLCRGARMDTVVQKATELGVTTIQPVLTERSVVRLNDERAGKKLVHWEKIAISACEQSGRNRIPEILPPDGFGNLLETRPSHDAALILHPDGQTALTASLQNASSVLLCTGPEGGFSDAELAAAEAAGFVTVTLGPRVLRTETAPLAALAVVQAIAGDFPGRIRT